MEAESHQDPLEESRAVAARIGAADWQLEVDPLPAEEVAEESLESVVASEPPVLPKPPRLLPRELPPMETPPSADRILEALLFVGGTPLTLEAAATVIRGYTLEQLRDMIDRLNIQYRRQNRPYLIRYKEPGYQLVERPGFQSIKERLFGGPREARLGQGALEVLSLVAYRQPITRVDLDSLRGADCSAALRQLVRLGLLAVSREAEAGGQVFYQTTSRFLELFGLQSLEDMPRLGESIR